MKKIFLIFFLFISITAIAQKTNRHTPVIQKGWYLSFNPHSIFELEQGAVGLGIGNRLSRKFEIWTELNYLYKGLFYQGDDFKNLKGIRSITSFKYYYDNKHGFFVGADFRIKNYSFDDKNIFINLQTRDTLTNYPYRLGHTLIGGGVFWGKRFKLSANGKFEMEGNIGIGVKQRLINRKNVPAGYTIIQYNSKRGFNPFFDKDEGLAQPYFPATFRFIYHL
jgi:hypothetical protein